MMGKQTNRSSNSRNCRGTKNNRTKNRANRDSKMEKDNLQDRFADKMKQKGQRSATLTGSADNDPSWYSPSEQITRDVASVSFKAATSTPLLSGYKYATEAAQPYNTTVGVKVPGILVLNIAPTIGQPSNAADAVNVSAQAIMSFMRSRINGARSYEAPDVMKYLIALDGAYALRSWMIRLYGVCSWYQYENRYTPDGIVTAMGVQPQDIYNNMAQLRAFINLYTLKLSQFAVPMGITYNTRHIWMFENVYTDSETTKAQYYLYNPHAFYIYSEGTEETASSSVLKLLNFAPQGSAMTFAQIVQYANSLIAPILASEDFFKNISGDILKAFDEANLIKLNLIAEDFSFDPVYSKEVLSQIENAEILPSDDLRGYIYEATGINQGYLVEQYGILPLSGDANQNMYLQPEDHLINFHWNNPSPDDVVVATRLKYTSVDPTSTVSVNGTICNPVLGSTSEVVASATLVQMTPAGALSLKTIHGYMTLSAVTTLDFSDESEVRQFFSDAFETMDNVAMLNAFDWAPIVRISYGGISKGSDQFYVWQSQPFCDLDVCTLISEQSLLNIRDAAMLKLFNVPNMSIFSFK